MDNIRLKYPDIWPSAQKYLNQTKVYVCNMFVMRRELFRAYSAFLFDVLSTHEKMRDFSHYSPVARRVSGYLGERICGMYLTYLYDKGYDGIDLQRVYFRNTDDGQRPATATGTTGEIETLNFDATVRGPGKIYSAIHVEHLSDDWQFRISSTTSDGKQVPAKVVQAASGPVAVFPIVAQSQTVSVSAVDADGRTRAQGSKTFNRRAAQLMSYVNRLSHNAEASTIRNCDKAMLLGDSHVVVDALINNLDATDIIHGHVSVPLVGDESAKDYVDIIALDGQGNQISMGDWICMAKSSTPIRLFPDCACVRSPIRCISPKSIRSSSG